VHELEYQLVCVGAGDGNEDGDEWVSVFVHEQRGTVSGVLASTNVGASSINRSPLRGLGRVREIERIRVPATQESLGESPEHGPVDSGIILDQKGQA